MPLPSPNVNTRKPLAHFFLEDYLWISLWGMLGKPIWRARTSVHTPEFGHERPFRRFQRPSR